MTLKCCLGIIGCLCALASCTQSTAKKTGNIGIRLNLQERKSRKDPVVLKQISKYWKVLK